MAIPANQSSLGLRVQVKSALEPRDFSPDSLAHRKPAVKGKVCDWDVGHGLCFLIQHEDSTFGWYDFDELDAVDERGVVVEKVPCRTRYTRLLERDR